MKEKIDQLYSEGINLLNDANYEEALKIFTSIKQLDESYHLIPQLYSRGLELLNEGEYDQALTNFTLIKQLDKSYIHIYYYYKGIINDIKGDDEGNLESKDNFYLAAADSFFEAAKYQDMPPDTYFLLGNTIYKAGKLNHNADKLSKALSIFKNNPYPLEKAGEVKKICSQIEQQFNNNSPMSLRGSYLYNSNSQLIALNNSDCVTRQEYNELKSSMLELRQDVTEIKLTIADVKKMLVDANVPLTATINNQIRELKDINPKLEQYYKYFNMALHNVFVAASAVSSGLVVPDAGHLERVGPIYWAKIFCYAADVGSAGFLHPIFNAVIAVLHDAGDNMFNSKEEVKLVDVLTKFSKMIDKQSDMTVPKGQDLQTLALFFANLRSAEITKTNETDFSNFFTAKLPMQNKFFRYDTNNTKEMNSNPMEKVALQDAISLISYMHKHAGDILKSSQPFLNKILTTVEEKFHKSWDDIKKTTPGNVEYDLWQIEKQLPESEIITEKAKTGQLTSINIPYFLVDFSKSYFPIISLSGIRRGIEAFLNKEYSEDKLTTEEQGCFLLFLAYKIFRYGNETCLKYFGDNDKYKELINQVLKDYPHLFFREEAINVCIKNETDRKKALDAIKLESSDKFFEDCFQKVFPNLNFVKVMVKLELKPKFEHGPVFESDQIEVLHLDIDENDVITIVGDVKH